MIFCWRSFFERIIINVCLTTQGCACIADVNRIKMGSMSDLRFVSITIYIVYFLWMLCLVSFCFMIFKNTKTDYSDRTYCCFWRYLPALKEYLKSWVWCGFFPVIVSRPTAVELPLALYAYRWRDNLVSGGRWVMWKYGFDFSSLETSLWLIAWRISKTKVCGNPPSKPALHSTLIDDRVWLLTWHSNNGVGRPRIRNNIQYIAFEVN